MLIEKMISSIKRDITQAELQEFIPTGLATLYMLSEVLDRLEKQQGIQPNGQDQTKTPPAKGKAPKNDKETENEGQNQRSTPSLRSALSSLDLSNRELYEQGQKRGCLCLSE